MAEAILSIIDESAEAEGPDPILALPFVREATAEERQAGRLPRLFWSVEPTGDHATDTATGERYARLALNFVIAHDAQYLMIWVMRDMSALGRPYSAVEIGFLDVFARRAVAAQRDPMFAAEGVA